MAAKIKECPGCNRSEEQSGKLGVWRKVRLSKRTGECAACNEANAEAAANKPKPRAPRWTKTMGDRWEPAAR